MCLFVGNGGCDVMDCWKLSGPRARVPWIRLRVYAKCLRKPHVLGWPLVGSYQTFLMATVVCT